MWCYRWCYSFTANKCFLEEKEKQRRTSVGEKYITIHNWKTQSSWQAACFELIRSLYCFWFVSSSCFILKFVCLVFLVLVCVSSWLPHMLRVCLIAAPVSCFLPGVFYLSVFSLPFVGSSVFILRLCSVLPVCTSLSHLLCFPVSSSTIFLFPCTFLETLLTF